MLPGDRNVVSSQQSIVSEPPSYVGGDYRPMAEHRQENMQIFLLPSTIFPNFFSNASFSFKFFFKEGRFFEFPPGIWYTIAAVAGHA